MWLVKCLKSLVSEHRSTVNILNSLKKFTRAAPSYCFITFTKIELENFPLSVSEILGVFLNTLTADDKYSLPNSKDLWQPIQLRLSKKQKILFQFFSAYLKSTSNVEHFEKKDDAHRLCILEIRDCERCG